MTAICEKRYTGGISGELWRFNKYTTLRDFLETINHLLNCGLITESDLDSQLIVEGWSRQVRGLCEDEFSLLRVDGRLYLDADEEYREYICDCCGE